MSINNLPEPAAHPDILTEPTGSLTAVRSRAGLRRTNTGLFIVGLTTLFANSVITSVILARKIVVLDPSDHVFLFGLATALAAVIGAVSLLIWGSVSDLTRSRFGRRTPYILVGGIGSAIFMALMGATTNVPTLIVAFLAYSAVFSALVAGIIAVFPDRIPRERRGLSSSLYGGAQTLGGSLASIIAAGFLTAPNTALFLFAPLLLVGAVLFVLLAPDTSSKDIPRETLDFRAILASFKFPTKAPDFYWAFAGRFLVLLGVFMISNFTLYILTDYMHLSTTGAASYLQYSGLITLVTVLISGFSAGPISDRLARRKIPIFAAAIFFAIGILILLVWPHAPALLVFAAFQGLGLGAFLSVDAALVTEVLPNEASRGKDLGILTTANNLPSVVAPLVTSAIVSSGLGYPPVFVVAIVVVVGGALAIFKIKSVR